jgi:plastocyanin
MALSDVGKTGFSASGPRLMLLALACALLFALNACGSGEDSSPSTVRATEGPTVVLEDFEFAPEALTVGAGDSVAWLWNDGTVSHDVKGEGFQSEVMSEGTFSHRFDEPGTYEYACTLHPNMTGTIEVTR